MKDITINTDLIHSNPEYERWIVSVVITPHVEEEVHPHEEFTVYVDPDNLTVTPCGTVRRSDFNWSDWIFENSSDVVTAAMIAALAVWRDTKEDKAMHVPTSDHS